MKTLCISCENIHGCEELGKKLGDIDFNKVITKENYRNCNSWIPADSRTILIREAQLDKFGLAVFRAEHKLPPISRKEDIEVTEFEDAPDFEKMLEKGVGYREREAQLRYRTNEAGEIVLDPNGNKIPREKFTLLPYACDQEGPVKAKKDIVLLWSTGELVDLILKAEKEAGLLSSPSTKGKVVSPAKKEKSAMPISFKKQQGSPAPASAPAPSAIPTKAEVPTAAAKVIRPTTAKKRVEVKAEGVTPAIPNSEDQPVPQMQSADQISELIDQKLEDFLSQLDKRIDKRLIENSNVIESSIANVKDDLLKGMTFLHDAVLGYVGNMPDEQLLTHRGVDIIAAYTDEPSQGE